MEHLKIYFVSFISSLNLHILNGVQNANTKKKNIHISLNNVLKIIKNLYIFMEVYLTETKHIVKSFIFKGFFNNAIKYFIT